MSSPALPLNPVVSVTVVAGPALGTPPPLNQGCIIGSSPRIPSFGGSGQTRIRQYTSVNAMLADVFQSGDPEVAAATIYFDQTPSPQYVWIGRQDLTSIATLIPHSGNAGTGYKVGDIVNVVQGSATGGQAQVTTIGGGGAVTALSVVTANDGTGYSVATALSTTGGSGTGLEVDITAIGETCLIAFENCRLANATWYAGMVIGAAAADHSAIFSYAQSQNLLQPTFYWGTTADAAVLNNTTGNIGATLKAANYTAGAMVYSTTQSGTAPNNAYACVAAMGYEMGANTQLANSYFTEWGKVLVGITAEPLTTAQVNVINGLNVNVYVGYVNQYTIIQPGVVPSGLFIDQVLNRAILAINLQFSVMNLLISVPSVPQTDPGEQQLIHQCNLVLQNAVNTGYLATNGTYEGIQPVINLEPGDPLPAGFLCQAYPYATQSPSAHAARQAMPIYIVINEAGAVQSVVIDLIVNLP